MIKKVVHKINGYCYYKINNDLKRITKLENNEVSYLDYDTFFAEINSFRGIQQQKWKYVENLFFISRDFEWEYNGIKYQTMDGPINWIEDGFGHRMAQVFHNGKIWKDSYSGSYYPRIYLEREKFVYPTREVLVEKNLSNTEKFINKQNSVPNAEKWTDIKYCRNFEKIS